MFDIFMKPEPPFWQNYLEDSWKMALLKRDQSGPFVGLHKIRLQAELECHESWPLPSQYSEAKARLHLADEIPFRWFAGRSTEPNRGIEVEDRQTRH